MNKMELYDITKNLTVLYVEDDEITLSIGLMIFTDIFKKIDTATNGESAYHMYEEYYYENQKFYDIVITDVNMPNMNGVDLCKKILLKNNKQNIIVISGYNDSDNLIEFINLGIQRFMSKPFSSVKIIEILEKISANFKNSNTNANIVKLIDGYIYDKNNQAIK